MTLPNDPNLFQLCYFYLCSPQGLAFLVFFCLLVWVVFVCKECKNRRFLPLKDTLILAFQDTLVLLLGIVGFVVLVVLMLVAWWAILAIVAFAGAVFNGKR